MASYRKYSLFLFLLVISTASFAQSFLSLDSAVAITLKNNYNILIAQNNYQEATNSHSPGVAGMLPIISLNAGYNTSDNSIDQKYSSGLEINKSGVVSSTFSPSVGLTWTLFDGMKMFVAYNQLGLLKDEGLLNVKAAIQSNIADVIEAYYNIVQQKELLSVIDSNLILYKEEMDIAQEKFNIGSASKLDYLQAEVNYNAEQSAYLKQQVNLTNAIVALNQLLEMPVENTYNVSDKIIIGRTLMYDSLKKNMMSLNPTLVIAQTNIKVAENNRKEIEAGHLPVVNLGLNYGLNHTQSNAGFSLYNQSLGFSGGLTLSWVLFNGMNVNIQQKNAELNELNAKFMLSQTEIQADASLFEAFSLYQANMKILKMDEANLLVAKENITIAIQQYRLGTSNIIQLLQAQSSYTAAGSQVAIDEYNAKVCETQLLLLAGQIVK
jgi:outer membrane protein